MSKKAGESEGNKRIRVQLGVCKRLQKEVSSYEREAETNSAKVAKMRSDGKDEYDIRKQEEVLQESYMMIPDSKARLEKAMEDLELVLEECGEDSTVTADMLEEARNLVTAFNNAGN